MIKMMRMTMMMREGINKQTGVFTIASPRHWHQPAALSKCKVVMMMIGDCDEWWFNVCFRMYFIPQYNQESSVSSTPSPYNFVFKSSGHSSEGLSKAVSKRSHTSFFPPLKTSWSSETNGCLSLAGIPKLKSKKDHSREEADQTKVLSSLPS